MYKRQENTKYANKVRIQEICKQGRRTRYGKTRNLQTRQENKKYVNKIRKKEICKQGENQDICKQCMKTINR